MNHSFHWKQNRIKQGPLPFEDTLQVRTDRFDKKHHNNNKEPRLKRIRAHVRYLANILARPDKRAASVSPLLPKPKRSCCYNFRFFCLFKAFFSKITGTVNSVKKSIRMSKRTKKSFIGH